MKKDLERNLGEQPIARIMQACDVKAHDLVSASSELITHKMVARACKGRRLSANVKDKVRNALTKSTGKAFTMSELFTY